MYFEFLILSLLLNRKMMTDFLKNQLFRYNLCNFLPQKETYPLIRILPMLKKKCDLRHPQQLGWQPLSTDDSGGCRTGDDTLPLRCSGTGRFCL